jgi:hypothetical protein
MKRNLSAVPVDRAGSRACEHQAGVLVHDWAVVGKPRTLSDRIRIRTMVYFAYPGSTDIGWLRWRQYL